MMLFKRLLEIADFIQMPDVLIFEITVKSILFNIFFGCLTVECVSIDIKHEYVFFRGF